jgi:hypothetical protein
MPEPSYDFFATGRAAGAPEPHVPAVPDMAATAVDRFGAPVTTPVPPAFPVAPGSGYAPGAVNQFGTPIDAVAVPTGPLAAPGIGAAPIAGPGMVSTWGEPVAPAARAAHAAPVVDRGPVPRNVRAIALLSMFFGLLIAFVTSIAISQYLALSDLVGRAASGTAAGAMAGTVLGVVLVGIVIMVVLALLFLVGGGATLANQRWGGWLLVVAMALYVLAQVRQLGETGPALIPLLTAAAAVALFLTLVTGDGRRWLVGR